METNSESKGFKTLKPPTEESIKAFPSIKNSLAVKESSKKMSCHITNEEDFFAYSGHNDYSSIKR